MKEAVESIRNSSYMEPDDSTCKVDFTEEDYYGIMTTAYAGVKISVTEWKPGESFYIVIHNNFPQWFITPNDPSNDWSSIEKLFTVSTIGSNLNTQQMMKARVEAVTWKMHEIEEEGHFYDYQTWAAENAEDMQYLRTMDYEKYQLMRHYIEFFTMKDGVVRDPSCIEPIQGWYEGGGLHKWLPGVGSDKDGPFDTRPRKPNYCDDASIAIPAPRYTEEELKQIKIRYIRSRRNTQPPKVFKGGPTDMPYADDFNEDGSLKESFLKENPKYRDYDLGTYPMPGKSFGVCFMPDQLISMADGTLKQIKDIVTGDLVKAWDKGNNSVKETVVTELMTKLHKDVYELYLENGKVLKPTGNHPFLTEGNGWATIDGHVLNSAGGNGYIKIGDYVKDIDDGWVKVKNIISIDGEYLAYDFKNEYKTIIADGIITHFA